MRRWSGLALALVIGVLAVEARGAPPAISQQGLLADPSGAPLSGTFSLAFRIFAAPSGGASLWTETQPSVLVVDGVYSVELGNVTPFPANLWNGGERYLEISANGETLTPRQRITSVPYALSATKLDGPALTGLDQLSGVLCNSANPAAGNVVVTYGPGNAVSLSCSAAPVLLSVTVNAVGGAGGGPQAVTSAPSGISCLRFGGGDCSESYIVNTVVTLTRPADNGLWSFVGWTGACTGSASTCVVNMNAAKSVTATFQQVL